MKEPNIGKKITDENTNRDAIHVAVTPVTIESSRVKPGQPVILVGDSQTHVRIVRRGEPSIGIIDPFLRKGSFVLKGEKCWLFLNPKTITSLTHLWTHPSFDDPVIKPEIPDEVKRAKAWLEQYAETCDGLSLEELTSAADRFLRYGDYFIQGGRFEGMGISDEFWDYYEIYKGETVKESDRFGFFSCSC